MPQSGEAASFTFLPFDAIMQDGLKRMFEIVESDA
jgi:hypothetical protein